MHSLDTGFIVWTLGVGGAFWGRFAVWRGALASSHAGANHRSVFRLVTNHSSLGKRPCSCTPPWCPGPRTWRRGHTGSGNRGLERACSVVGCPGKQSCRSQSQPITAHLVKIHTAALRLGVPDQAVGEGAARAGGAGVHLASGWETGNANVSFDHGNLQDTYYGLKSILFVSGLKVLPPLGLR